MVDFSECEFIHDEMTFYTFEDFCNNKLAIKSLYNNLSKNGKRFFMWYVYANTHINLIKKNAIWDYLNGFKTEKQLLQVSIRCVK